MRHLWGETWTLSDSWSSWCVLVKVWLLNTHERQMLMCVIRTDDQGEWRCTSVLVPVSPNSLCKPFKSRQTHFNSVLSSIYCHLNRACSQLSPFTFNCSLSLPSFLPSFFSSFFLSFFLSFFFLSFFLFFSFFLSSVHRHLSLHRQSIYLSVCLSFYDCIFLSFYVLSSSVCLSFYLFVCLCIQPSVRLSIVLSSYHCICLSFYLLVCLSIYPSICLCCSDYHCIYLSIYLSVYLSVVCLSIYLSIHLCRLTTIIASIYTGKSWPNG